MSEDVLYDHAGRPYVLTGFCEHMNQPGSAYDLSKDLRGAVISVFRKELEDEYPDFAKRLERKGFFDCLYSKVTDALCDGLSAGYREYIGECALPTPPKA